MNTDFDVFNQINVRLAEQRGGVTHGSDAADAVASGAE